MKQNKQLQKKKMHEAGEEDKNHQYFMHKHEHQTTLVDGCKNVMRIILIFIRVFTLKSDF